MPPPSPTHRAEHALDVLNIVLADVRYGLGPYAIIYLMTGHAWDEAGIALAFSFGGMAGLLSQVVIGAMVDAVRAKRALLIGALVVITVATLAIVLVPSFWSVAAAGVAGALANSTIGTTMAAISLGVVGPAGFARRAARNEALFHAGSAAVNLVVLAAAPHFGIAVVFWMLAAAAAASAAAVLAIPARAISYDTARGLPPDATKRGRQPSPWGTLLTSRPLLIFALCGALFHLANGSMLGLVVQRAARVDPGTAIPVAAAAMIAAQLAMVATAALAGMRADTWGRRPFFLAAFAALALRGTLYTLSSDPAWTIAVQVLDGVGVGVFGALFPVLVADLTRGSGRFNAAQGVVGTVHSIGGILSAPVSGLLVVWAGYDATFLAGASVAALGGIVFWLAMPETSDASTQA